MIYAPQCPHGARDEELERRRPAARRERASEGVNLEVVCSAKEGGDLDVESR